MNRSQSKLFWFDKHEDTLKFLILIQFIWKVSGLFQNKNFKKLFQIKTKDLVCQTILTVLSAQKTFFSNFNDSFSKNFNDF